MRGTKRSDRKRKTQGASEISAEGEKNVNLSQRAEQIRDLNKDPVKTSWGLRRSG